MQDSYPEVALGATAQYFYQLHNTPALAPGEEEQLLHSIERHDTRAAAARSRFVEAYQPLVLSIAKRYFRRDQTLELLDVIQEGNLGLLDAIDHYQPTLLDGAFSSWAFTWIRGAILRSLNQDTHLVRLPAQKLRLLHHYDATQKHLYEQLGHQPTLSEIAQAMQMSLAAARELCELQRIHGETLSIYRSFEDADQEPLEIPQPSAAESSTTVLVRKALASLPAQERLILTLRFGLEDGEPLTQPEVAKILGTSTRSIELIDRRARLRLERLLAGKLSWIQADADSLIA